jgi:hypothetical protein
MSATLTTGAAVPPASAVPSIGAVALSWPPALISAPGSTKRSVTTPSKGATICVYATIATSSLASACACWNLL